MAENSRKNEFFERESIAIIAITINSSIKVKRCWVKDCFFMISYLSFWLYLCSFESSNLFPITQIPLPAI